MANLNTFVCASCGHEFVVKDMQEPECPDCGVTLKRSAQTEAGAERAGAKTPAAGAGYR